MAAPHATAPIDAGSLLNTDVWLAVASFLRVPDLVTGLAPTCRYLYAIANDPFLWANIPVDVPSVEVLRVLADKLMELLGSVLPDLETDGVHELEWGPGHGRPLRRASTYDGMMGCAQGSLREVDLYGGSWSAVMAADIATRAGGVTRLSLSLCAEEVFTAFAPHIPLLRQLVCDHMTIRYEDWVVFVDSHDRICELELVDAFIVELPTEMLAADYDYVKRPLSVPKLITKLTVVIRPEFATEAENCEWHCNEFAPALVAANAPSLEEVRLEYAPEPVCVALGSCTMLQRLSVDGFSDGDATRAALEQLSRNVSLRECHTPMMEELIPALHKVTELRGEWVRSDVITHLGAGLAFLRKLTLSSTTDLSVESARLIGEYAVLNILRVKGPIEEADTGVAAALAPACQRLCSLTLQPNSGWDATVEGAGRGGRLTTVVLNSSYEFAVETVLAGLPPRHSLDVLSLSGAMGRSAALNAVCAFVVRGGSVQDYRLRLAAVRAVEADLLFACLDGTATAKERAQFVECYESGYYGGNTEGALNKIFNFW